MEEIKRKGNKSRVYLGIDPASGGFAYTGVLGRVTGDQIKAKYLFGKKIKLESFEELKSFVLEMKSYKVSRVGIEVPGQFGGSGFESSYLISSAINIGMLIHAFSEEGIYVTLFPAQVQRKNQYGVGWRYYLFDKKRRKRVEWDDLVKDWLAKGAIIKYPARSNKDVRDSSAIAYALYLADRSDQIIILGGVNPYSYHSYLKRSRNG